MTDSYSGKHRANTATQLTQLRDLIVGPTNQRLRRVEREIENPNHQVQSLSRALPQALTVSAARDNRLTSALDPILGKTIRASIIRDRQILVDALFPVMGPAIRKAIASTIQGMIDNFNQVLDQSLSLKALHWRLEAFRTRRSFAEIVLLNTLVYQVEQVFLIQHDSGLLIEHVFAKTAVSRDPDLVSAMLTAIQDFVHDSFGADQEDTVDSFQVGERKIWIEHGRLAMLAVVIRGNPPVVLKKMMRDVLDDIHLRYADALSEMDGSCHGLDACQRILSELLQVQFKKRRPRITFGRWAVLAVVVVLIGWGAFAPIVNSKRLATIVDQLRRQPGFVVTELRKQDGRYHIYGMKDPYAPDPSTILETAHISEGSVVFRWEPYQSNHPAFVLRRADSLLDPPPSVTMTVEKGTLRVTGAALHQWIAEARRLARFVPWIDHYDDQRIVDINMRLNAPPSVTFVLQDKTLRAFGTAPRAWMEQTRATATDLAAIDSYDDSQLLDADDQAWQVLFRSISHSIFYFEEGKSVLVNGQEKNLQAFIESIKQLTALSRLLDRPFCIDVLGHADQTGDEAFNIAVSLERAQGFADLITGSGLEPSFVSVHALGSREPANPPIDEASRARNRRVIFKISQAPPQKPIQSPQP